MLKWTAAFFIIALIAGIFGFTGIAEAAVDIAQILFFVFVVLFFISLVMTLAGHRKSKVIVKKR